MRELEHWHPVALSRELRRKPLAVRLWDQAIVLFRTASGAIGALEDRCPHRRMRLSCGHVAGDRIVCPYHGWSFARDGSGESPGTPRLRAGAPAFEAVEREGAVWVKPAGCAAAFPEIGREGYGRLCTLSALFRAPLETVLDNFTEVEHTATTHAFFGYDDLAAVETRVEADERTVRVFNRGPQKRVPWIIEWATGARSGDVFADDWTTHFSPVHAVYDQRWTDAKTGVERPDRLLVYVVLSPASASETRVFTFAYCCPPRGKFARNPLHRFFVTLVVKNEIELDRRMVARLADPSPTLAGMQLGRFDKTLGENRRRIDAIYRGRDGMSGGMRT